MSNATETLNALLNTAREFADERNLEMRGLASLIDSVGSIVQNENYREEQALNREERRLEIEAYKAHENCVAKGDLS